MRRTTAFAAAALIVLAPSLASAKESREAKLKKPRIVVLSFPAAAGAWGCGGWGNSEGRMANVLRDLFTTEIMEVAEGKVRLVERERLEAIRDELKFQQSGEVDGATAQKVGKLLGVRYMLTGKMTRFACKKSGASTGWGVGALVGKMTGSGLAGAAAGSVKTHKVKFTGRLDVRLIDTQSGEVLGTFKDEEETGDTSVKVAGGGTEVDYDDELANKVFEPVVERLTPKIVKKIGKVHEENLADDAEDEEEDAEEGPPARASAKAQPKVASVSGGAEGAAREAGGSGARRGKPEGAGAAIQVYGNEFDFVPGEKLLVFDDFSDTEVGDYPAKWTAKGGGGGPAEVVAYRGGRWFKQRTGATRQETSITNLRYQVKGDMPEKFTIEYDAVLGPENWYVLRFNDRDVAVISPQRIKSAQMAVDTSGMWPKDVVEHVAVSVSGTYLKLYVGGRRLLSDPDGVTRPVTRVGLAIGSSYHKPYDAIMFTNLRLAEGGKDVTQSVNIDGRIVTHGITFDTGSEVIRPESGPTLRKILKLLQDDAALRFEIQGHTDDQGGDAVNGPLSEKRAAAVKAWLVGQGIDDARLTTRGLGATKPLEPNASPEARANNRRVELVKLTRT